MPCHARERKTKGPTTDRITRWNVDYCTASNQENTMEAHILVVEDDATARMLLADVLLGAGYHVTTAHNGEAALNKLEHQAFDVVITDIRMHQVDGIQVLQAAREQTPPPSVLLLTGYGSLETAVDALRAGAHDYLLKPAAPDDLLRHVANALERRNTEIRKTDAVRAIARGLAQLQDQFHSAGLNDVVAPITVGDHAERVHRADRADRYIEVGHLTIDHFRHTALFAGEALHLTPIEYALLRCLAESQGRVMNYREIVRCSHGHETDDTEAQSLLKAHIRNLRRKIDSRYLVNVRGTGYMLVDPAKNEE